MLYAQSHRLSATNRMEVQVAVVGEVTDEMLINGGRSLTIMKNKRDTVERLFETGKGNKGQSVWDLYNGATEWVDHYKGNNEEKRFASAMFGDGANIKGKAFQSAMALV